MSSSSSHASDAERVRCSGAFSSSRITQSDSAGSSDGTRECGGSGISLTTRSRIATRLSAPVIGGSPQSISYAMAPSE